MGLRHCYSGVFGPLSPKGSDSNSLIHNVEFLRELNAAHLPIVMVSTLKIAVAMGMSFRTGFP